MYSVKTALMAGTVSLATATAGFAQDFDVTGQFDRVISFGDSYSDTGNRVATTGETSPFFLPGRISNGPVFTELLSGGLESMLRPTTDSAFQTDMSLFSAGVTGNVTTGDVASILGASDARLITFTNDLNAARGTTFTPQNIVDGAVNETALTEQLVDVLEPDDVYNLPRTMDLGSGVFATSNLNFAVAGAETLRNRGFIPSTRQQVEFYFNNGGTFNDGDLITFLSGANDNSQLGAVDAATLGNAVADENISVLELIAANGSGTVAVIGLADLTLIPGGRVQPPVIQDIVRTFSQTAIDRQFSELNRIAGENPNVNFIYVDLQALQNAVEADPESFGFTNITDTCIMGATFCSDPDSFFFIDFIHPTQPGHELLASLVVAHVLAGQSAANTYVMDELALASRRTAVNNVFDRLNRLARRDGEFALFVEGFGSGYNRQRDGSSFGYTADLAGMRVGGEGSFGNGFAAGVALSFSDGDVNQQIFDFGFNSIGVDVYGRYGFGRNFVDLTLGFEDIDYDNVRRVLNVGPLVNTGSTGGQTFSVAGRVGQTFELPNAYVTPALKLAYYDTQVDGFAETGALARLSHASRSSQYLIGGVEMLADFQATQSVRMFASLGYDFLLYGNEPTFVSQLINNPAQPFVVRGGEPDVEGLDVSVGFTANIGAGFIGTAQFEWLGQFDGSNTGRVTFGITKPL